MSKHCPLCEKEAKYLVEMEPDTKSSIQASSPNTVVPDHLCPLCYEKLTQSISRGSQLRVDQIAKDKNRQILWKGRTKLIRQARQLMTERSYAKAAVSYEKYLRVVEIAHNLKPGELTPDVFSRSLKSKELTIITSAYWDLVRIYDTSPHYKSQMQRAAGKLIIFLPHSAIYQDIMKKGGVFARKAKHPLIIKTMLKKCRAQRPRCFIATSVYDRPKAPEIEILRAFRDQKLKTSFWGRKFVYLYYRKSPPLADWLNRNPFLKPYLKFVFSTLSWLLKFNLNRGDHGSKKIIN